MVARRKSYRKYKELYDENDSLNRLMDDFESEDGTIDDYYNEDLYQEIDNLTIEGEDD